MRESPASVPASAAPEVDRRMGGWTGVGHDDIEVGQSWPATPVTISREQMARFLKCIGQPGPAVDGMPVPAFLLNELRVLKSHMRLPPGVLHAQEELQMSAPARVGEPLTIGVSIRDKYLRNGKRFVVVAQAVRRAADGALLLTVLHTLYWPC